MVRTSALPIALLAGSAAAFPYLRVRQDNTLSRSACFPYEVQVCAENVCTCESPKGRTEFGESNASRRTFVDKVKEFGIEWGAGAFTIYYPEVYSEWFSKHSSRAGETAEEFAKKKKEAWDLRGDLLDTAPEIYGDDWMPIYEKLAKNDTTGLTQVPGTEEYVKDTISPERLQELPDIVHKVNEAEKIAFGLNDIETEIKTEEFKKWFEEWFQQEEKALGSSESDHLKMTVCGTASAGDRMNSLEKVRAHMDNGRYIWEMDDFIARLSREEMSTGGDQRGAFPWPEQYAMEYGMAQANTVGALKIDSCRTIPGSCSIFKPDPNGKWNCEWFWDNNNSYNGRIGFWAWEVISGVHEKISWMSSQLTKETLETFLKLDKLNEDFNPEEKEEDPAWKWFKFAFGLVTTVLPMPPGVDEGLAGNMSEAIDTFQLVVDTFESISDEVKEAKEKNAPKPISSADLGEALAEIFGSMQKRLLQNLETALGKTERVNEWETLPEFGNTANLKTPIGKFLNNPLWLLDNDSDSLKKAMAHTAANVQHKIIDMKLRSENYHVTLDTRSKYKCEGKGARTFNYAGGDKCFRLYKIDSFDNTQDKAHAADDGFYDKLAKYGIEGDALTKYYQSILDCYQKKGKDGELDENDAVIPGGSAPTCYFSLRTAKLNQGKGCDISWAGQVKNCVYFTSEDLEK